MTRKRHHCRRVSRLSKRDCRPDPQAGHRAAGTGMAWLAWRRRSDLRASGDRRTVARLFAAALIGVLIGGCGGGSDEAPSPVPAPAPTPQPPTGALPFRLMPAASNLAVGGLMALAPVGATPQVTFQSSNTALAQVDVRGVVTGVAAGTAVITMNAAPAAQRCRPRLGSHGGDCGRAHRCSRSRRPDRCRHGACVSRVRGVR